VLVVDECPVVRQALADLVNRLGGLSCCGQAADLDEAAETVLAAKPELVVLDVPHGQIDGIAAVAMFKARFPETRLLVISHLDEATYAEGALRAGVSGFIMKQQPVEELANAIRTVMAGQIYASPQMRMLAVTRMLERKPSPTSGGLAALSDRELHVFKAVGAGRRNKEIAAELHLSVKTIETYREHIKYKLGFRSGAELLAAARKAVQSEQA
jgi:DNA-binding NarL/FixJ family response regulator